MGIASSAGFCTLYIDKYMMNREIGRLRLSLDAAEPGREKLVFLHYPPVYTGADAPEIVAVLKEYGIRRCFYARRKSQNVKKQLAFMHQTCYNKR